ncbi:MAG: hypothetical protein ACFFAV_11105 [Candidatus Hermodarchaeota archaeon]
MGSFARRWFYNLWCIVCILVFVGIGILFQFEPIGIVVGMLVAGPLFCIEIIIGLIMRFTKKVKTSKIQELVCPRCMITVDKEIGICPQCGTKL